MKRQDYKFTILLQGMSQALSMMQSNWYNLYLQLTKKKSSKSCNFIGDFPGITVFSIAFVSAIETISVYLCLICL